MAEKKILDNYFVLAETASQANVPFTPGTLIIEDGGQAYYDPSTGTDISSRIIIGDQAGIDAALEQMTTELESLEERVVALEEWRTAHDVLATADKMGHVKLFDAEGDATDGTMTQAAITTALAGKAEGSHTHAQGEVTGLTDALTALGTKDTEIENALNAYKTSNDEAVAANKTATETNAAAIETNAEAIAANTSAIEVLNGGSEVPGSVDAKVAVAVAGIVAGADENYDTLKEIADYIATDATGAAELSNKVAANEAAIKTINETTIPGVEAEIDALEGTVSTNAETLATHISQTYESVDADPHGVKAMKADLEAQIAEIGKIVRYE